MDKKIKTKKSGGFLQRIKAKQDEINRQKMEKEAGEIGSPIEVGNVEEQPQEQDQPQPYLLPFMSVGERLIFEQLTLLNDQTKQLIELIGGEQTEE